MLVKLNGFQFGLDPFQHDIIYTKLIIKILVKESPDPENLI